jgi:uncharacterized protein (DUF2235 family)
MKRLVICCDGTWNNADSRSPETNVALLARSVHATQATGGVMQVVLYLRGVGTSGLQTEVLIEGATGLGIDENIRSAYMFIAQNYLPGDEIFLFGFSRGAYTARSLAGFIGACGILKRQRLGDLAKAWHYYRKGPLPHSPQDFVRLNQSDSHTGATIKFLGVWDTVGALGVPGPILAGLNHDLYGFLDTGPCAVVKHGCHALAIDEHRDEFVPTLWTGEVPAGVKIEQVWFAGAHADVGGGYVTRKLADIPLVWMARKAEEEELALDWSCLPDPDGLDPKAASHNSSSGFFYMDRLRPTYREICETACDVSFYERLYAPVDANGKPLATINQKIHRSLLTRFAAPASVCSIDPTGICADAIYRPLNLAPFFDKDGHLKAGIEIAD